jgi:DNA-binding winged helix-turn-helix (wHTH) protein/Tol biopolymer transport system component
MTPRETASVAVHPAAASTVAFGGFLFDRANGILSRGGEEVPLPPRALGVLSFLLDRPGRVVSKQALLDGVWNGAYVTETSLSEAVSLLRQALGDDAQRPLYIQTVHRRGYRFIAPLRPEEAPGPREAAPHPAGRGDAPTPAAEPGGERRFATAVGTGARPAAESPAHPRRRALVRGAALAGTLALVAGGFLAGRLTRPGEGAAPAPQTRFAFAPPGGNELLSYTPSLAVSPDGRRIVYAAAGQADGDHWLFERPLGATTSRRIPGSRGAMAPFFSPDGTALAFFAEGELRTLPLGGGTPVSLAEAREGGGSWGGDGTIVFSSDKQDSLFVVPAAGGAPRRLTRPDPARGEIAHWWPQRLPGAEAVVFTAWHSTLHDARVEWLSLRTGERRTLVSGGAGGRYAAGRLLWARPDGTVLAAPFDVAAGRLTAPPAPLQAGVATHPFWGFTQLATGGETLAFLPAGPPLGQRRLVRFDGTAARDLPAPVRFYRNLRVGPRGKLAATLLDRDRSDVWLVDPMDGALSRLTFEAFNIEPVWSPDGEWVAFASNRTGAFNVHRRRADGSAPPELLMPSARHQHPVSWSPDGRELLFGEIAPETGFDVWVLDLATRRTRPLLRAPGHELYPAFSPDGRWVAYLVEHDGRWEVMVRSYPFAPGGGGSWQVSVDGGAEATWRPDGRALIYRRGPKVWEVPVAPEGRELNPGAPRRVLQRDDLVLVAAAPAGGLYAIVEDRAKQLGAAPREIQVVVGWESALPQR